MEAVKQILPAVAAVIFNEKGEILLQKRKDVNKWCIISGHVEFGETVRQAIVREIKEETTAQSDIVRLIGVYSSPEFQTYHYGEKTVQYITSYFEVQLKSDIPENFTNEETEALQFFDPKNLPGEMALINPNWLNDALSRKEKVFLR